MPEWKTVYMPSCASVRHNRTSAGSCGYQWVGTISPAPQTELVVATLGLLEHEAHRTAEVTVGEGGHRVERAKTKQSLRSLAAEVGAVVVVGSDVLESIGGDLVCPHVEHRSEKEDLIYPAEVHALQDALGALPLHAGEVRVDVQDPVQVVEDFPPTAGSVVLAHAAPLSWSARCPGVGTRPPTVPIGRASPPIALSLSRHDKTGAPADACELLRIPVPRLGV